MQKIIKEFFEFLDFVDWCVKYICIVLTGLIALTVTLQVLFRYILQNPLVWTEELSRYLLVWVAFLGASSLIKNNESINVEYFIDKFPTKISKILKLIIKSIILIFCISILVVSIIIFAKVSVNQLTPAMQISMLYPQFGIVVGLFLISLQMFGIILKDCIKELNADD